MFMTADNQKNTGNVSQELWNMAIIINAIPGFFYSIDPEGHLINCNNNFRELLKIEVFSGLPYEKMAKALSLSENDTDEIQYEDSTVVFSRKKSINFMLIQNEGMEPKYYKFSREPLINQDAKKVNGVAVFISEEAVPEKQDISVIHQPIVLDHAPRVLLVEDNEVIRCGLRGLFRKQLCEVYTAGSDDEALAIFNSGKKLDLIMMDIGLPDSSGYVVSRRIREAEKNTGNKVPIIGLTGFVPATVLADCKDYQMEGVIAKPLLAEQAEQILDRFVRHKDVVVSGMVI